MTPTATPATFLDELLSGEGIFPFTYSFTGDYAALGEIKYRELPQDAATALVEAVRADVEALGLDPLPVVLTALSPDGDALTGEAFLSHQAAVDALNLKQRMRLGTATQKISGALVAQVLGQWEASAPITPETCAKLPTSVQRTILELSQERTLGADAKN